MILQTISYRPLAYSGSRRYHQFLKCAAVRSFSSASVSKMASESDANPTAAAGTYKPRYIDIGINLADPIFRGVYHGTQRHPDDLSAVISRAREVGCQKLIVTGSDLKSSRDALEIAKEYPGTVYTTAGIHPCSSAIFGASHPHPHHQRDDANGGHTVPCGPDPSAPASEDVEPDAARTASIIAELEALITSARSSSSCSSSTSSTTSTTTNNGTTTTTKARKPPLVALGELGLDYDRLHYSPRRLQRHAFAAQLELAARLEPPLPLFLHSRAAHADFAALLRAKLGPRLEALRGRGAVVHSFTGTAAELRELLDLGPGLRVGVNGCGLKTAEGCGAVALADPDRLLLETDGPWCEIRPSHEGWRYLVEAAKASAAAAAAAASSGSDSVVGAAAPPPPVPALAPTAPTSEPPPPPPPPGTSTPTTTTAAESTSASTSTPASGTSTPNSRPPRPQQQQQQPKSRKKQPPPPPKKKKEPEVPERYPVVKKERWAEGAMVKGRNEPCMIERVAVAVAGIRGVGLEELCEAAWANTRAVFDLDDDDDE